MKRLYLLFSLIAMCASAYGAETFRTDINPALQYYRAFLLTPDLTEADSKYLFEEDWRGRRLDERFGKLVGGYDNTFKLLYRASHAEAPCDWGLDLSDGPDALLPGLARAKRLAQAARLRVLWNLQHGRQEAARDDLLAVFALARYVPEDKLLISALVQYAMENIVISIVAENFGRFDPETLKRLIEGFESAPSRGSIRQCVPAEKAGFYDWLLRQVAQARESSGEEGAEVLAKIRKMVEALSGTEDGHPRAGQVMDAAGGTVDGFVGLVHQLEPFYARADRVLALPYSEIDQVLKFDKEVADHPNPLVAIFFSIYRNCRLKEFTSEVYLAMLKAAVAHREGGATAFRQISDPCGSGPFRIEPFFFDGIERGIKLTSALEGLGFDPVLIFVTQEGPVFQVVGKNAGKALD